MNNKYVPGMCNIGSVEREHRRNFGIIGIILTILLWIFLIAMHAKQEYKLTLFIPAYLAAIGLLKDRLHFCAEFGILGIYNFEDKIGSKLNVMQKEFLKQDRIKALKIILLSAIIAITISLLAYFLS